MQFPLRLRLVHLFIISAACLATSRAVAIGPVAQRYAIFQDGYSEGAVVTGSFTGADLDGNGILVHFPLQDDLPTPPIAFEELTAFSMRFSGNSLSPAFDLGFSELFGFVYQLGTDGIGDDPAYDPTLNTNLIEGIGAIGTMRFFTSGLGPNGFICGYVGGHIELAGPVDPEDAALDSSQHLVRVALVPEPSLGVIAIVSAMIMATVRRRAN
jgi:hypothetical protein